VRVSLHLRRQRHTECCCAAVFFELQAGARRPLTAEVKPGVPMSAASENPMRGGMATSSCGERHAAAMFSRAG